MVSKTISNKVPSSCPACAKENILEFNVSVPDKKAKSYQDIPFVLNATCLGCKKNYEVAYVASIPKELEDGKQVVSDGSFSNCKIGIIAKEATTTLEDKMGSGVTLTESRWVKGKIKPKFFK
jgi:hydrogenase maturation factor